MKLIFSDATTLDLDQLWVPENLFDYQVTGSLERLEGQEATFWYSDDEPNASPIVLTRKQAFASISELQTFVNQVNNWLRRIDSFEYESYFTWTIAVAYFEWKFGRDMKYLEGRLVLVPTSNVPATVV